MSSHAEHASAGERPEEHPEERPDDRWEEVRELAEASREAEDSLAASIAASVATVSETIAALNAKTDAARLEEVSLGVTTVAAEDFSDDAPNSTYDRLTQQLATVLAPTTPEGRQLARGKFVAMEFGYAASNGSHAGVAADRLLTLLKQAVAGNPDRSVPKEVADAVGQMAKSWTAQDREAFWARMAERFRDGPVNRADLAEHMVWMGLTAELSPLHEGWLWDSRADVATLVEKLIAGQAPGSPIDVASIYDKAGELAYGDDDQPVPIAIAAELVRLALASHAAAPEFPPDDQPLPLVGSGTYKKYYYSPPFRWGWLETNRETRANELDAYTKLRKEGFGSKLPETRLEPIPTLTEKDNASTTASCGYWIENINLRYPRGGREAATTLKPLMMARDVIAPFKTVCGTIEKELGSRGLSQMLRDLRELRDSMPKLTQIVGEVTLGIDRGTGRVLLVDVAPEQGGQTAESQTDKILLGIEKMIQYVEGLLRK